MSSGVVVLPGQTVIPGAERGVLVSLHESHAQEWAERLNTGTRRKYRAAAADVLRFGQGALTAAALVTYRDDMEARGLQPATIRSRMAAARSLAAYLHDRGSLDRDGLAAIEGVQIPKWRSDMTTPKAPVDPVIDRMIAAAAAREREYPLRSLTDQAVIGLTGGCGGRRAEACAVLWDDYTFARPTSAAKARRAGSSRVPAREIHWHRGVKRGQARKVAVPGLVALVLDRLQAEHRRAFGGDLSGIPILLAFPGGWQTGDEPVKPARPMSHSALTRVVDRLSKAAGAEPAVSPHALRHAYAMRQLEGGASIVVVQHRLGHTDPGTTLRYLRASDTTQGTDSWDL